MATPNADQVLGTTELLERILLFADAQDILLSQRVAKFWRVVIRNSLDLQRALFLTPLTQGPVWTGLFVDKKEPVDHDRTSIIHAVESKKIVKEHERNSKSSFAYVVRGNPLLNLEKGGAEVADKKYPFDPFDSLMQGFWEHYDDIFITRDIELFLGDDTDNPPSWREMYLTQPPVTDCFWITEDGEDTIDVDNHNGVTLGDIADSIKSVEPGRTNFKGLSVEPGASWSIINKREEGLIEEGIAKFEKLESKVGRENALKIGDPDRGMPTHPGPHISKLLEGDNLDKLVAAGKLDHILAGGSIIEALEECEMRQTQRRKLKIRTRKTSLFRP